MHAPAFAASTAIICTLGVALWLLPACSRGDSTGAYATKVRFRQGKPIRFPDFTLTYRGKRRVTPPQYPRGWWAHDFTVLEGKAEQTVTWSAGTGAIGPAIFKAGGKSYALELSYSDKLRQLRDDEVVVSRFSETN